VDGAAGEFSVKTVMMDEDWKAVKDGPTYETEAIAVSYGLHPNNDLSRRCECLHTYDHRSGVWTPVLDAYLRTSQPGIYMAGDGALVKGYEGAALDGKIAGLAALTDLGMGKGYEKELFDLQKSRRKFEAFALALASVSEPGSGYFDELSDDVKICRCESVRVRDVKKSVAEGARDRNGLKRRIRLGMGHCQGRYCGQVVDRLLSGLIKDKHVPRQFSPRTPVLPVRIGVLADGPMPADEEFRV
jgi:NAD(P)H-nitrite reductase large subunit